MNKRRLNFAMIIISFVLIAIVFALGFIYFYCQYSNSLDGMMYYIVAFILEIFGKMVTTYSFVVFCLFYKKSKKRFVYLIISSVFLGILLFAPNGFLMANQNDSSFPFSYIPFFFTDFVILLSNMIISILIGIVGLKDLKNENSNSLKND